MRARIDARGNVYLLDTVIGVILWGITIQLNLRIKLYAI